MHYLDIGNHGDAIPISHPSARSVRVHETRRARSNGWRCSMFRVSIESETRHLIAYRTSFCTRRRRDSAVELQHYAIPSSVPLQSAEDGVKLYLPCYRYSGRVRFEAILASLPILAMNSFVRTSAYLQIRAAGRSIPGACCVRLSRDITCSESLSDVLRVWTWWLDWNGFT
jgi:hypothetical protein